MTGAELDAMLDNDVLMAREAEEARVARRIADAGPFHLSTEESNWAKKQAAPILAALVASDDVTCDALFDSALIAAQERFPGNGWLGYVLVDAYYYGTPIPDATIPQGTAGI